MIKNWNSFLMVSGIIISIILFASGKLQLEGALDQINLEDSIIAALKTILVTIAASVTIFLMIIVLLIDVLITILLRSEFPITNLVFEYVYLQFFRGWYWDAHSGNSIFMACIILFGIGLISLYISPFRRRKKKFIYHKKSEKLKN
ncbi:MAG: hypothetical protein K0B37_15245 [Bacteroidales bacterium]|nr:hypothetical protein [Bacteroidales bacterium]